LAKPAFRQQGGEPTCFRLQIETEVLTEYPAAPIRMTAARFLRIVWLNKMDCP
jgi:hypothetical protein